MISPLHAKLEFGDPLAGPGADRKLPANRAALTFSVSVQCFLATRCSKDLLDLFLGDAGLSKMSEETNT